MRSRVCLSLLSLLVSLAVPVFGVSAQGSPDYLDDAAGVPTVYAEIGADTMGPPYRDMLAAGYLLGLPAATMTAGVGLFMPVGVHYARDNPTGGTRAFFGILGGLALGATVGGLLDQPKDGFAFTTGMLYGMLGGYFTWGTIDVAFFADRPRSSDFARVTQALPQRL